jgi:hypothetical protein
VVGSIPGKREFRRFTGDYVLNQKDIIAQNFFEDRIAFGGWSIDLHPPQGMYSTESGSKHLYADGIYHIPFRSLYSVNVSNLMFAGRNISATHVAFGTTRVVIYRFIHRLWFGFPAIKKLDKLPVSN